MKHGFLFWVSLLFVSVVMALFTMSSNCFALSYDDIQNYIEVTANYFPNNANYQVIKSTINNQNLKSYLENNLNILKDYSNLYVYYVSGSNYGLMYIYIYNGTDYKINLTNNTIGFNGNYRVMNYDVRSGSLNSFFSSNTPISSNSIILDRCCSLNSNYYNNLQGMNYTYNYIEDQYEMMATYVGNQGISRYSNLEFVNNMENAAYNGNLYTYYYQGDFYSNSQIKLGDVVPNDSYYFEIRLRDSKTSNIKGTSFVALNTNPYTFYNDGAIYINNSFEVYVIPRLLSYSNQYQLEIESYYGDGGNDDLEEDIDWFIFLPQNATISGDVITFLGSGDFTQQDNTNTIIGFLNDNGSPSGDLQAILDTSGNILSGDLFKDIKMPQIDGMNKRTLFDLLYAIAGTLGESGDAYFDFQLHGETPTRIYASQFRTPDGPLKTLISSFLVFLTFYFLLSQFRHTIEMLSTANVKGAIEYVDTSLDNMFYM